MAAVFRILKADFVFRALTVWALVLCTPGMGTGLHDSLEGILNDAKAIALARGHSEVGLEHLTSALLDAMGRKNSDHVRRMRETFAMDDGDLSRAQQKLQDAMEGLVANLGPGSPPKSSEELTKLLKQAEAVAQGANAASVTPSHLLLALSRAEYGARLPALADLKLATPTLTRAFGMEAPPEEKADDGSAIERFTTDLTQKARDGKLQPIYGRDGLIKQAQGILMQGSKNSLLLHGDEGTGRLGIVEGLVQKIEAGEVPERLRGKQVLTLDYNALKAGTKYRGELEERLKLLVDEVKANPNIILFVPNAHNLLPAKNDAGGEGGDVLGMLAAAQGRGELTAIFTTNTKSLDRFEQNAELSSRVTQVLVEETTPEKTLYILRKIRPILQRKHDGLQISDEALRAAVHLSNRYTKELSAQPGNAWDLLEAAATGLEMERSVDAPSTPGWDTLAEDIDMLVLDREALREKIANHQANRVDERELEKVESRLAALIQRRDETLTAWEQGKKLTAQLAPGQENPDAERLRAELSEIQKKHGFHYPNLEPQHLAKKVSEISGKPAAGLLESDEEKYRRLEPTLRERVIGQDQAVEAVARRARIGGNALSDEDRPMGSFLFYGSTGVGKTQLAMELAATLFDDPDALIRFDMSEYMNESDVNKLIGSPPGYQGADEPGHLTEAIRRRPYSVLLFDEIEKAHPNLFYLMYQLLDAGRLTDNRRRTVRFENAYVIFTSNLGEDIAADASLSGEQKVEKLKEELKARGVPPAFVGRLGGVIPFNALGQESVERILGLQLAKWQRNALESKGIELEVSERARKKIAELGYDPSYGARPLRLSMDRHVEGPIADLLTEHGDAVRKSGRIVLEFDEASGQFTYEVPGVGDSCSEALVRLTRPPIKVSGN